VLITAGLVILGVLPFALVASIGRGYLLPLGVAVLTLIMANLVAVVGYGEYFPWTVPGLYAMGKAPCRRQLLDRAADRPGGHSRDHPVVEIRRTEPVRQRWAVKGER